MSWHVSRDIRFIVHTQNGDAACETAAFIGTLKSKASNMAMSVSRFINIHKLRCPMIHNYCYYIISMFIKV